MKLKKSFTLIELLVVIAIIGILTSLVVLNITTGKDKANNAKRVQEADGLVKALSIYETQYGFSGLSTLSTTLREVCNTNDYDPGDCPADMVDLSPLTTAGVLSSIPVDPSAVDEETGYWIAKNSRDNEPMVVPGDYQSNCPEGYISVPGNSYYHTLPGFCAMTWGAKCDNTGGSCGNPGTAVPVSKAENKPWISISQINSRNRCEAAGDHLITDNEWMTIARNAEAMDENWTGGSVGSGSLFRGNSNTGSAMNGSDPLLGINTRTHTLTNGEVVWDIAGNVYNWTDESEPDKDRRPSPEGQFSSIANWGRFSRDLIGPSNPVWDTLKGVGYYYVIYDDTTRGAFRRGGYWSDSTHAGLFSLVLDFSPTSTHTAIGFRCAR